MAAMIVVDAGVCRTTIPSHPSMLASSKVSAGKKPVMKNENKNLYDLALFSPGEQ